MNIKWIFMDLGNTLINEEVAQNNRINQLINLLKAEGIDMSHTEVKKEMKTASSNFAPRIIKRAIENIVNNKKLEKQILKQLKYEKSLEKPYPDAEKILNYLYPKYKIGVIANQSKGTKIRLKKYDLWQYFSLLFSSAEIELEKPDLKIYKLALNKAECSPEESVIVGDRLDNDISPANKIGINTIRIMKGFHKVQKPRNINEKPDYCIDKLIEINDIL
ncbi:MAG: HAD family hydrolase [Candidatus Woesearchaeota archaeon]